MSAPTDKRRAPKAIGVILNTNYKFLAKIDRAKQPKTMILNIFSPMINDDPRSYS